MNIKQLSNKKLALLGLGVENLALAKFLLSLPRRSGAKAGQGDFDITVCDYRSKKELSFSPAGFRTFGGSRYDELEGKVKWQLGKNFKKDLHKFDILLRSPGWPLWCPSIKQSQVQNQAIVVTSPIRLFFDWCPGKIIGVTGTKGKGTTASIIYEMLKPRGNVYLGGNIGTAPFDFFPKLNKKSLVILELSSFQLEDLPKSPHVAVVTNVTEEHLKAADPNNPNYHLSLAQYKKAKENLIKHQGRKDVAILNADDKYCGKLVETRHGASVQTKAKKFLFSSKKKLVQGCFIDGKDIVMKIGIRRLVLGQTDKIKLRGEHNLSNIGAASLAAYLMGAKINSIKRVIKNYKGLEHRLELVKEVKGVKYYNDSFATAPEPTIAAIKSFQENIILILGGADKGSDFKKLGEAIVCSRVKAVVLIGQTAPKIKKAIQSAKNKKYKLPGLIRGGRNMRQIVQQARKLASPGDVVLLSPACASFGLFINYKDRGERFKRAV